MNFLVDTQLPPRLAAWFSDKGYDSRHTMDYANGVLLKDREIREIAIKEERIIITKDSDFEDFFFVKGAPPRILLISIGNCSNSELINRVDQNLNILLKRFRDNSNLVVLTSKEVVGFK